MGEMLLIEPYLVAIAPGIWPPVTLAIIMLIAVVLFVRLWEWLAVLRDTTGPMGKIIFGSIVLVISLTVNFLFLLLVVIPLFSAAVGLFKK
jgi:hypothetical protein